MKRDGSWTFSFLNMMFLFCKHVLYIGRGYAHLYNATVLPESSPGVTKTVKQAETGMVALTLMQT